MSVEGIFRKNGNIRRLKDLTDAIDRDPSSVDLSSDNAVQLAALLKKFLRELPDPLMTFKLHRLFIASQSESVGIFSGDLGPNPMTAVSQDADRKRLLHMVSLLLPKAHRDTLEVLFVFLKWVACFAHLDEETGSKMDLGNLATVICPSILYSRGRDAVRDESFGAIRVITSLLENQDEFYTVPVEFLSILRDQEYFASSMDLTSKDFLKKVDTYMRLKSSGRPPGASFSGPSNNSQPRYPPPTSPNLERPPMQSLGQSERPARPPNVGSQQQMIAYSPPTVSPSPPQGAVMHQGRPPQEEMPTRPVNLGASGSRPISYVGSPRPNGDAPHFSPNGHPPAVVRQRT